MWAACRPATQYRCAAVLAVVEGEEAGQAECLTGGCVQAASDSVVVAAFAQQAGDVAEVLVDQVQELAAAELVVHAAQLRGDLVQVLHDTRGNACSRCPVDLPGGVGEEPLVSG